MDLGASSGLLPVHECSAEMCSSPMSEEFLVGPWSCEGAGHCTGGRCSSLGRVAVRCEAELDFTFFSVHHFFSECPASHFSSAPALALCSGLSLSPKGNGVLKICKETSQRGTVHKSLISLNK